MSIEFKVTGKTWKEILEKLEGLIILQSTERSLEKETVIETTEQPTDEFKPEWKEPEPPLETIPTLPPAPPTFPPPSSPVYNLPGISPPLDSAGYPWNPDIHTRTKATNDNGTWRLKRKTPHFEKKTTTGPVKPKRGKIDTPIVLPDFTVPTIQIADLTKLAAYATKINKEKNLKENVIREYLTSIGIPNVISVPAEKLPEVAEKLKTHFGVDY